MQAEVRSTLQILVICLAFAGALDNHTKDVKPRHGRSCPKPCSCLMTLVYCDGITLTSIPKHIDKATTSLNLKHNFITRIRQHQLAGLTQLKHLLLKGNRLEQLRGRTFNDLHSLVSLSLTNNRLTLLSPKLLHNLRDLRVISLRDNLLKSINNLFDRNRRLQLINAADNKIEHIDKVTLSFNNYLRVLDLHNNSINFIHKHAFSALPLLKYLILRDNPLKQVELNFKYNFHLELLDFTNCKLREPVRELPRSVRDLRLSENNLTRVTSLDFAKTRKIRLLVLNNNQISDVSPESFKGLWRLYDVYLSKNKIRTLPKKWPKSLHALYVNHNQIEQVEDETFQENSHVKYLQLRNNKIQKVAENAFVALNRLKSLDLSQNLISDVPEGAFRGNKRMERLDLSMNPIKHLAGRCFEGLRSLHILQMASVSVDSAVAPDLFRATRNLAFLDLSNSPHLVRHLAELPYVLRHLRNVEDLNLMMDDLHTLPKDFPKHFPKLKSVKLVGNPWHCDRSILWLTGWIHGRRVDFHDRDHLVCASPPEMKGRLIADIHEDELATDPPPLEIKPQFKVIDMEVKQGGNRHRNISWRRVLEDEDFGDVHREDIDYADVYRPATSDDVIPKEQTQADNNEKTAQLNGAETTETDAKSSKLVPNASARGVKKSEVVKPQAPTSQLRQSKSSRKSDAKTDGNKRSGDNAPSIATMAAQSTSTVTSSDSVVSSDVGYRDDDEATTDNSSGDGEDDVISTAEHRKVRHREN